MRKYLHVFKIGLQNVLQHRASLLMDRVGGIAVLLALYYFWSSLLSDRPAFLGYTREQMLTYVLGTNLLRSLVFTGRGWDLVTEISSGRLSSYLLRPIRYPAYSLSLDLAQKSVHLAAACLEIGLLCALFKIPVFLPVRAATWLLFAASAAVSSLIFFHLEFLVSSLAFWTAESGGPLFCFELFLQFASGAFFPLDVLPGGVRQALHLTPFPYMASVPLNIYLERIPATEAARLLSIELAWLVCLAAAVQVFWRRGLRAYAAEGG